MKLCVFGPPGCGKTEFDLRLIEDQLSKGVSLEEVSYVTLMKSAAIDGARRFGITGERYRNLWFRTLHSTAFRVLDLKRESVVDSKWLKEFSMKNYFMLSMRDPDSEDDIEIMMRLYGNVEKKRLEIDDIYYGMYNLSRLMSDTVEKLDAVKVQPFAAVLDMYLYGNNHCYIPKEYESFVSRYEAAKESDGKVDFIDMLANVVREGIVGPWKVAVVDEGQDISPLGHAAMNTLYRDCKLFVLSGDSDQALMRFAGASADGFLNWSQDAVKLTLLETHRFGQKLVDYAAKISRRIRRSYPKDIIGLEGRNNEIRHLYDVDYKKMTPGDLALHRHVSGCNEITERLIMEGVPVWNERGINPLSRTKEINAFLTWNAMRRSEPVTSQDLQALAGEVTTFYSDEEKKYRLLAKNAKKEIKSLPYGKPILPTDLQKYFTEEFLSAMKMNRLGVTSIQNAPYYSKLAEAGFNFHDPNTPVVKVTTIHGSKGRQAKNVWIYSETYPKCLENDLDQDESRIAYVAATRAEEGLNIIHDRFNDWSDQYNYPA